MSLEEDQIKVSAWLVTKPKTDIKLAIKAVLDDLKLQVEELKDRLKEIDRNLQGGG